MTDMEDNEAKVKMFRWMVIENIVTIIGIVLGCWLVSMWFLLLMLNLNNGRISLK